MKSSLSRLLQNSTLLDNKMKNNEIDKLINCIIKELNLTIIAIKNNEIDSIIVDKIKNRLKSS